MKRTTARLALPLAVVLAASALAGCKLPYQVLSKLVAPKPTPAPTPLPAKEVQVEVVQVDDERVRGESDRPSSAIAVQLPTLKWSEVAAARVIVRKAVDDLGTDLVLEKAEEARFEGVWGADAQAPAGLSVRLKNAPRKAKVIKEVTVDAELYTPALDLSSVVKISNFLLRAGTPIVDPVLKEAGIEIVILSKEQIEAERKAYGERRRAEAKKLGLTGDMLEQSVRVGMESFLSSSWVNAYLKVKDPKGMIFDYVYESPSGEVEGVNRGTEQGFITLSGQGGEPGVDHGLQVRLKTPKAFQRYSFTLRDIALP